METKGRPAPVGAYELLADFEGTEASVRVLQLSGAPSSVRPHRHRLSVQIYVALSGTSIIEVDGVETVLTPYHVLEVPRGRLHAAQPAGGPAILMNISVPPLAADDQAPAAQ